jgi:ornithine carbamoyltransferase
MTQHLLQVCDLSHATLLELFDASLEFESAFRGGEMPRILEGMTIAMCFEDDGFRNRAAFELGIQMMGGKAVYIPGRPGLKEPAADMARYLGNWFNAIIIRTPEYAAIEEMAAVAGIPVINARTRYNHPCEILGDLSFVRKTRGSIEGLKVVFVGEATNLCHSWLEAAAALPIEVVQVCPQGYEVNASTLDRLSKDATGRLRFARDLEGELEDADVVYTDCWPGRPTEEAAEVIEKDFQNYRITSLLLELAPANCVFLPCPPVTRGEEVSDDAMVSPKCRVYEAKDYLLHAQNALLALFLER